MCLEMLRMLSLSHTWDSKLSKSVERHGHCETVHHRLSAVSRWEESRQPTRVGCLTRHRLSAAYIVSETGTLKCISGVRTDENARNITSTIGVDCRHSWNVRRGNRIAGVQQAKSGSAPSCRLDSRRCWSGDDHTVAVHYIR